MGPAGKLCHPCTSPWTTNLSPSPLPSPSFRSLQTLGVAAGAVGVKTHVPCERLIKIPRELPLQAAQVEAALDAEPNQWRFASRRPCEHAARRPEAGAEKYSRGVRPFINPIIVGELSDGVQGSSVPDPAGYLGLKCCFAPFPAPHLCPRSDAEASPACWGPFFFGRILLVANLKDSLSSAQLQSRSRVFLLTWGFCLCSVSFL